MFGSFSLGKELIRVYQIYILEYRGEWFKSNSVFFLKGQLLTFILHWYLQLYGICIHFVYLEPFCH